MSRLPGQESADVYYLPLLLPLLLMVLLTFVVWFRMYYLRLGEMHDRGIEPEELATRAQLNSKLPRSAAASDNLMNLFEMPVLFYLAIVLALILLIQDPLLVVFAWLYLLLRAAHSFIHTTYNKVEHRFWAYFASCAALFVLWARLAWHLM